MTQINDLNEGSVSTERRNVLKGAGIGMLGAGALAATTVGGISSALAADHGHHHHGMVKQDNEMIDTLYACIKAGNACVTHCIEVIKSGDISIVDCMKSVQETVAFCEAHVTLSSYDSKYLNAMCELSIKICQDCQAQCEKHKKHVQCRECAESCVACIKMCKKHLKA